MKKGKEELICDFAEYYHIYDYRTLSLSTVAVLASGLRENSRSMMKIRGDDLTIDQTLLSIIYDQLRLLVWLNTKDAQKGHGRPKALLEELKKQKDKEESKDALKKFNSPDQFEAARNKLLKKDN